MALSSRRGAPHVRVDLQNTKPFGSPVGPGGAPGVRNGALASARWTFYLKIMLTPPRGAHFHFLGSHAHHLGSAKLSSRRCAVRLLKNELSLQRGVLFYIMKSQCFWRAGTPRTGFFGRAAVLSLQRGALFDSKRCSRFSAVLICIFGWSTDRLSE